MMYDEAQADRFQPVTEVLAIEQLRAGSVLAIQLKSL
jgi:hypothetical protein